MNNDRADIAADFEAAQDGIAAEWRAHNAFDDRGVSTNQQVCWAYVLDFFTATLGTPWQHFETAGAR